MNRQKVFFSKVKKKGLDTAVRIFSERTGPNLEPVVDFSHFVSRNEFLHNFAMIMHDMFWRSSQTTLSNSKHQFWYKIKIIAKTYPKQKLEKTYVCWAVAHYTWLENTFIGQAQETSYCRQESTIVDKQVNWMNYFT